MNELINDTGNANKYFKLTADLDFAETTIDASIFDAQAADGGVNGALVSINPDVSSNSNVFFHLDGNSKTIKNVTIDLDGFNSLSIFGYINSASTTTNLTVSKSKITNKYIWRQLYGGVYGQYAVRFNGHVLFHSVPYTSMSKNTLKAKTIRSL